MSSKSFPLHTINTNMIHRPMSNEKGNNGITQIFQISSPASEIHNILPEEVEILFSCLQKKKKT